MRAHRSGLRHRRRYPASTGPIHSSAWRWRQRGLAWGRAAKREKQLALVIAWVHEANRLTGRARAGDQEVGKVSVWGIDEGLEVSIYVVPELRRRGIGMQMLAALPSACAERWPRAPFIARISPGNIPSRRLFKSARYTLVQERSSEVVLRFVRKDLQRGSRRGLKRYRRSRRLRLLYGGWAAGSFWSG